MQLCDYQASKGKIYLGDPSQAFNKNEFDADGAKNTNLKKLMDTMELRQKYLTDGV